MGGWVRVVDGCVFRANQQNLLIRLVLACIGRAQRSTDNETSIKSGVNVSVRGNHPKFCTGLRAEHGSEFDSAENNGRPLIGPKFPNKSSL